MVGEIWSYGESRLINSNETSLGSIAPRFRVRSPPSPPSPVVVGPQARILEEWNILQHPPPGIRATQKRRLDTREAVPVASHLYLVLPFQLVRGRLNEETRIGALTLSTSLS